MMSAQEQEAFFLRKIAIHECGHAYVASHYGMGGYPSIWRNTGDNRNDENLWLGTTRYIGTELTPLRHRRLAIAGIFAEYIDSADPSEEIYESELENILYESLDEDFDPSGEWSRLDWEGAQGWTKQDVHAVYMILTRNWKALVEEAEMLMAKASENGFCSGDPNDAQSYALRNG